MIDVILNQCCYVNHNQQWSNQLIQTLQIHTSASKWGFYIITMTTPHHQHFSIKQFNSMSNPEALLHQIYISTTNPQFCITWHYPHQIDTSMLKSTLSVSNQQCHIKSTLLQNMESRTIRHHVVTLYYCN